MSDIVKKNEGGLTERDPFRAMRELLRWDPFRDLALPFGGFDALARDAWSPSFEVRETKDSYVFRADVPGVKKDDLEVSLRGSRLQISGKREAEQETKDDTFYTYERSYGSFQRAFTLPDDVDAEHVRSELKDGVLTVAIPKKAEAKAKKIAIGGGSSKS